MMSTLETSVPGSRSRSAEQRELRALAREFAEKEIRPRAAGTTWSRRTRRRDREGARDRPDEPAPPDELGGLGLPIFEGMLIGEELSWGCSGIALSIVGNTLGAAPVLLAGSEAQKRSGCPRCSKSRSSARSR